MSTHLVGVYVSEIDHRLYQIVVQFADNVGKLLGIEKGTVGTLNGTCGGCWIGELLGGKVMICVGFFVGVQPASALREVVDNVVKVPVGASQRVNV